MVNKDLIEAIYSGDGPKCGLAVYFTFMCRMNQCFEALCECVECSGKENAISVIKDSFSNARADAELAIRETLLFLANRGKGDR